jgi:type I restriction enzyme S subunit
MGAVENIITENLPIWSSSVKSKSSAGRGTSGKRDLYGIKKLRELILDLAVRGLLVPQDPNDEPASVLLEKIAVEKERLIKQGKIKKQKKSTCINEKDNTFCLPNNWEWVRLASVAEFINGFAFKSVDFKEQGIGVVKIGDIQDGVISPKNMSRVSPDAVRPLSENLKVEKGDMVIAMSGATTGKLGFNLSEEVFYLNQRVGKIFIYCCNPRYIYFPLTTKIAENLAQARGMAIPNLSTAQIKDILLPLPPLAEQHRIATKVDELMALCDTLEQQQEDSIQAHETLVKTLLDALTNAVDADAFHDAWQRISVHFDTLLTTEQSVDKLKETILQLAVMGKLVPQDPNDEPASVLLHRIVTEKEQLTKDKKIKKYKQLPKVSNEEKSFELPEGWIWCRVWDVASIITSGSRGWAKYYSDSGAMFVTMGNLSRGSYTLRMKNIRYVSPPASGEGKRTSLTEGDLLISITGDVGNLGLIPSDFGEAYINQHTALLRLMPECKGRFVPEFMRSPFAKYQFDAPQRGIKNSFRLGDVGEMIMALPPLLEQCRIVAKLDELMALCDQLIESLQQAQQSQIHLTDAVVENAF